MYIGNCSLPKDLHRAMHLAAEGVKLCIAARRNDLLEELAAEITAAVAIAPAIIETDYMQDGAPQKLADAARAALGHVDILVNSAGGSRPAMESFTAFRGRPPQIDALLRHGWMAA